MNKLKLLLLVLLSITLPSCSGTPQPGAPAAATGGKKKISISPAASKKIGNRIWKNECGGTVKGLTSWNKGEYFASLGIGHFIWYPKGKSGPYEESFPPLIRYMQAKGVRVPGWLQSAPACPWQSRSAFMGDFSSSRMNELRSFLHQTIPTQTEFIVRRLEGSLPKMKRVAGSRANEVEQKFYAVGSSSSGVYALMDYVNFKGEGTNPKERYKGKGWGMLQVLLEMRSAPQGRPAAIEYSAAAKRVLGRRIANAPKDENRWRAGWFKRCDSYAQPF